MANPRIVFTLAGVFLAGVGTGMLGMRFGLHQQLHPSAVSVEAAKPSAQDQAAVLEKYRTELNLSPEQTAKLAAVLDDYKQYYQSVQEEMEELRLRDQIDDLRATGKNQILDILNAEQRKKFEQMTDPAKTALP